MQIRMQAQYQSGSNEARKGMMGSFASMFKEEGIRGLYRVIKMISAEHLSNIGNNYLSYQKKTS